MIHTTSKKEKGTINSTPDSVKNQFKDTIKDSFFKNNTLTLIDKLITDLQRNRSYLINDNEIRWHNSYINQLTQIKRTVLIDPRYPHKIVQQIIDNLFLEDNQIKGVSVDFLFTDIKNNPKNFTPNVRALF